MTDTTRLTGGCLCGAIRYDVPASSAFVSNCHCSQCRRASSAVFQTWMEVPAGELSLTGTLSEFHSSDHGVRSFCGECGAQIQFHSTTDPDHVYITVATLDDPEAMPPTMNVHVADGVGWIHIDDGLARYMQMPGQIPEQMPDETPGNAPGDDA